MTMYTISQLTAKLVRQERRVAVQYKGKTYLVEVASACLSDYTVTAVGHKQWGHSQPCMSVAECKDWIRTVHGADVEEAERKSAEDEADLQALQSTDAYVLHHADIKANVVIAFDGSEDMFALPVGDACAVLSEARQKFKLGHVTYKEAILLASLPFIKIYMADREHKMLKAEVQKFEQYERNVAYVTRCSREERRVDFTINCCSMAIVFREQVADALFNKADEICKRNNMLFTPDALLLAGMPLINAHLLKWHPDVARELGVTTCRDAEPHTSQPVSKAASTQQLILPPGFRLQRTRKDAVHWHCEQGGVSRDFSTAAEAVEFAWLCWENVNK